MSPVTGVIKRLIVGRPYRTDRLSRTLLPKRLALPVYSSDAISSIAYAPQEILLTLASAGLVGYAVSWQVGLAVGLVMAIVIASYRLNVMEYPDGGGDYAVTTKNLGPTAGLLVASALLLDYVLTVAVSVSAAATYASSALPALRGSETVVAVGAIVVTAFVNLRGVKESGRAFALPTYFFMAVLFIMSAVGFIRWVTGSLPQAESAQFDIIGDVHYSSGLLSMAMIFLVARAFASGCAALTGVEAISNGVPQFRKPSGRNAAITLAWLGGISLFMFASVLMLAAETGVRFVNQSEPWKYLSKDGEAGFRGAKGNVHFADGTVYHQKPVIGQLADTVFNNSTAAFIIITVATGLILVMAANTAFNGFPVLTSVLARDGYLPRQLRSRGDRLVYSNGIIVLAGASAALVVAFNAQVTHLVQLYIVGVFVAFTLSQLGMVRHWTRKIYLEDDRRAQMRMRGSRILNALSCAVCATVLVIVVIAKFNHGALFTVAAIAVLLLVMRSVRGHYLRVRSELSIDDEQAPRQLPSRVTALVLVSSLNRPTLRALSYARASRPSTLEALAVDIGDGETAMLQAEWKKYDIPVTLRTLESPYRELSRPIVDHIKSIRRESPRDLVVVYIPEYVLGRWWEALLHNQSANRLKAQLRFTRGVIVASIPWQLESSKGVEARLYAPTASERTEREK